MDRDGRTLYRRSASSGTLLPNFGDDLSIGNTSAGGDSSHMDRYGSDTVSRYDSGASDAGAPRSRLNTGSTVTDGATTTEEGRRASNHHHHHHNNIVHTQRHRRDSHGSDLYSDHGDYGSHSSRQGGGSQRLAHPVPPQSSSEYLHLVGHAWSDRDIAQAEEQGRHVHWLATSGRVPPTAVRPGTVHRKTPYKDTAEAINAEAHPGHLHEQPFSSSQHKDRAVSVSILTLVLLLAMVFAVALTGQLWSLLHVDRRGMAHLQLKPTSSHVLCDGPMAADRVELGGDVVPPSTTSDVLLASGRWERVSVEVGHHHLPPPYASVQASSQHGVTMTGPRVSTMVRGGVARSQFNASIDATVFSCPHVSLHNVRVHDGDVVTSELRSMSTTPLTLASPGGPGVIQAGRSVVLDTSPLAGGTTRIESTQEDVLMAATVGPIDLIGGTVRLNLSDTVHPLSFDAHTVLKVCVCPQAPVSTRPGTLYLMPPNASCTDIDAPDTYNGTSPC